MTILHISDTHGFHKQLGRLPITDIIVHTGDFTSDGTDSEASDFIQWFCRLPHKHKVFIAGNHDMCMFGKDGIKGLPENVHYLCNSSMEIEGIKFYGMPMFMENMMGGVYDMLINAIPDDVNVLLTHQPPYGILDEGEYHGQQDYHYGNSHLFAKILDVKPTLHFSVTIITFTGVLSVSALHFQMQLSLMNTMMSRKKNILCIKFEQ